MNLAESICVVTGAARGIGRAIAEALLADGARVILSDSNETALADTVAALGHPRATGTAADVTSGESLDSLVHESEQAVGPIDLWVNNAGLARHRRIVDYTEAEIELMLAVNLKGVILGSQAALRVMAPRRRGYIVNIASTASLRGVPTETVYCAAKWGVRGFTQGLREEAAANDVRVTAVLPGGVDTPFWQDALPGRATDSRNFLRAADVAEAVVALARMDDRVVPQELVLRAMHDRDFGS
jgi:NAD(P)-dependent dehydrogenase (short-subunit alcohol dehydrogenase family)